MAKKTDKKNGKAARHSHSAASSSAGSTGSTGSAPDPLSFKVSGNPASARGDLLPSAPSDPFAPSPRGALPSQPVAAPVAHQPPAAAPLPPQRFQPQSLQVAQSPQPQPQPQPQHQPQPQPQSQPQPQPQSPPQVQLPQGGSMAGMPGVMPGAAAAPGVPARQQSMQIACIQGPGGQVYQIALPGNYTPQQVQQAAAMAQQQLFQQAAATQARQAPQPTFFYQAPQAPARQGSTAGMAYGYPGQMGYAQTAGMPQAQQPQQPQQPQRPQQPQQPQPAPVVVQQPAVVQQAPPQSQGLAPPAAERQARAPSPQPVHSEHHHAHSDGRERERKERKRVEAAGERRRGTSAGEREEKKDRKDRGEKKERSREKDKDKEKEKEGKKKEKDKGRDKGKEKDGKKKDKEKKKDKGGRARSGGEPEGITLEPDQLATTAQDILGDFVIKRDQLELIRVLGEGAFGQVFFGKYLGTEVAIKKLKMLSPTREAQEDFMHELGLMRTLRHPNVVLYMGVCVNPPPMCIVTEFCSMGSLDDVLHKRKDELTRDQILSILDGTARGMAYLHNKTPKIIHRDLKSANLLLAENFQVKIADFGVSRMKYTGGTAETQTTVGSPLWMAPEVIRGESYGEKCDVYSFAIVMWEIFERKLPYHGLDAFQIMYRVGTQRSRPGVSKETVKVWPKHVALMKKCWDDNPRERPGFAEVIQELAKMR